ncbi:large low complexity with signal peptide [Cryptosporidium xiaoi]|uniref:Large low complexity with signal peptide n=1 Tax=Cryptosporidium xiaoi TaxID=659607 RepID=A0AAV9XYX0_9CRYT
MKSVPKYSSLLLLLYLFNNVDSNNLIVRPGITTRKSSEGLGRTYDKGVTDTNQMLESYYDGDDNWRHYRVVTPDMDHKDNQLISDEYSEPQDTDKSEESKFTEPPAIAQTPADYKFPEMVLPQIKGKIPETINKDMKVEEHVKEQGPQVENDFSDVAPSEDETEVLKSHEESEGGTEYEYQGQSEGFGPSNMGFEALDEFSDPPTENYSYEEIVKDGENTEEMGDYGVQYLSESGDTDNGMSYILRDEKYKMSDGNYDTQYIIGGDGSESFSDRTGDNDKSKHIKETRYINESEGDFNQESVIYKSEGPDSEYSDKYVYESERSKLGDGYSEKYIENNSEEGTEYDYISEVDNKRKKHRKDGKKDKVKIKKRINRKDLPRDWETLVDDESEAWINKNMRDKGSKGGEYGDEGDLINKSRRRKAVNNNDISDDEFEFEGRRKRYTKDKIDDDLLDEYDMIESRPRKGKRRVRAKRDPDYFRYINRGRRGYDRIRKINGEPYMITVGDRILSKYPNKKRDNILRLRDVLLESINNGKIPENNFEDLIDPVDLMLLYKNRRKMPILSVKEKGNIPLEFLLKLPKGIYRWEELDPKERNRLKKKWKEEIASGTFWDEDKIHGDWGDEIRLLGEWGEEESLRGFMDRETKGVGDMGSYYVFDPTFTDLKNKGVFSSEYPEDIEHSILVGNLYPERKIDKDFRLPERQILMYHPEFIYQGDDLMNNFNVENLQSMRNENPFYWKDSQIRGQFGRAYPEDKYSWIESLDMDDAIDLIRDAQYNDPEFAERLIYTYPWLREKLGNSLRFDDDIILPIQVLNEFIPRSVGSKVNDDSKHPGGRWYFSEIPDDQNLDRYFTDIYRYIEPRRKGGRVAKGRGLREEVRFMDGGIKNMYSLIDDEHLNSGWDRETINYLRELFRDAENRILDIDESERRPRMGKERRKRRHTLNSTPDTPIWYFGTDEQINREKQLEFAIETDSLGGIIENRPIARQVFVNPRGIDKGEVLGLDIQELGGDYEHDIGPLYLNTDYMDSDDLEELDLETMGNYRTSRSPISLRLINRGGKRSDNERDHPFEYRNGMLMNNFKPIRRVIYGDDDIDDMCPLTISQTEFLHGDSGFNSRNPLLIDRINLNRRGSGNNKNRNKRKIREYKVNEFGHEDPMDILMSYYDSNENSILDVFDDRGIYRPTNKRRVGYGMNDVDYIRRSNDDDWNYLKLLRNSSKKAKLGKGVDKKPLWYYYDSIGRRWDDTLEKDDDEADSSIDLIIKEIERGGNKRRNRNKVEKSRRNKRISSGGRDKNRIMKNQKNRKKGRKQKRVHFKMNLEGEDSKSDFVSDITNDPSDYSSQETSENEETVYKDDGSDESEEDDDIEELSPLGKRLLMAAGYDDDLDPSKPLSIESEILNVIDTGKRSKLKINKKNKKKELSLDDMLNLNTKIKLDKHDLSEIRRIRRDMDDESGDLEALKNLVRKLHLKDYINLDDDSKEEIEKSEVADGSESEVDFLFVGEKESSDVSSTAQENEVETESKTEFSNIVEDTKSSDGHPMKLIKFKKGGKSPNNSDENSSSSSQEGKTESDSQFDEELSISEWDSLFEDTLKEIRKKNDKKKRKGNKRSKIKSGKNIKKNNDERKALNELGITPNVIRRVNLMLKDNGAKNALDYLLNELEDNIGRNGDRNGKNNRRKNKRKENNKNNRYYERSPYDLEPVTPSFSRYIIKLNDVLGPKEALEELLDNLGVDLSLGRPVRKELRRYLTPDIINEVNQLRKKKNGDELALNRLMNVLRIPRRGRSKSKRLSKRERKLPALLNEDDIKTVNRLLRRNKTPQALEFFIKNTGMDKDMEDLKNGFYKMNDSYSGLNLPAETLVKISRLRDMGPRGCREALSDIYDDLRIPKQRHLFDGSLDDINGSVLRLPDRNYQRRMVKSPSIMVNKSRYYLDDDLNDDNDFGEGVASEYSQYDDFSTIIPRNDIYRLIGRDMDKGNNDLISVLESPLSMVKERPVESGADYYHNNYDNLGEAGLGMLEHHPSPRLKYAPLTTKYDDDLRNYVNSRRNSYGMPDIPSYHYWNYYPEITGRSKYSDLNNNSDKRMILERKRKLGDYLNREHSVPVPVETGGKSPKTMILKSYVDDDLPVNKEEMMLIQRPDHYSEEELYEIGQKLTGIKDSMEEGKLKIGKDDSINSLLNLYGEGITGVDLERKGSKEEIISSLVSDPLNNESSKKELIRYIADNDDSVIRKLNNLIIDRPMMNKDGIPNPIQTLEKIKELKNEDPNDKGLTCYTYLDTTLDDYDKKILSDDYVNYLENLVNDDNIKLEKSLNLMEEDCKDINSQIKLKELNCDGLSREDTVSRTKPLDARKLSRSISKIKNIYAKSFLKQINLACDVARLFFRNFSDFKAWNKAMDKHRWVALPLVSPQSYIPNMGGLNIFQRIMYNQVTRKYPKHSPRRVLIIAISSKSFSDRKLPNSFTNIEFSSKNYPVEYVMNVEYNKDGMMIVPLVDLALCIKGGLQLHNLSIKQLNKSSKPRLGTCLIGGVKTHSAAQKVYRTALKYLEMSSDLTLAKFMIIPIRIGSENLSEQLKLAQKNSIEKNFDIEIPEDTISPMISDMEFSKMQFEMTHENNKKIRERYNKKLIDLNESIFKIYLMSSRELDIRSLKANGPRVIVIPMSFPQLYIKGYNNAMKLVKRIQKRYKPGKLSNRAYRNKLKPGFILLINDKTVKNDKQFLIEQMKRIQSFFTNPYSFKNFKSKKYEGPVFEIRGVNDLLTRKYLLDTITKASRQPSVVPMIILPIFVDNNERSQKSDRRSMKKSLKKTIKHSANV